MWYSCLCLFFVYKKKWIWTATGPELITAMYNFFSPWFGPNLWKHPHIHSTTSTALPFFAPCHPLLWLGMRSAKKTPTLKNGKYAAIPSCAVFKCTLADMAAQTRKGIALACYHWTRIATNMSNSVAWMFMSWVWEATKDNKTEVLWKMWYLIESTVHVLVEHIRPIWETCS